jgi:hypothetical protein
MAVTKFDENIFNQLDLDIKIQRDGKKLLPHKVSLSIL